MRAACRVSSSYACIPACHRERLDTRRRHPRHRAASLSPSPSPRRPSSRTRGTPDATRAAAAKHDVEGGGGGIVHLIGAGPGGLDNLTVRALRLLRTCDAVVYDDLGAADMIDEVPPSAERIYVGTGEGCPTMHDPSHLKSLPFKSNPTRFSHLPPPKPPPPLHVNNVVYR